MDLRDIVVVGHSTGGGEVVRFAARPGAGRVSKVVTVGSVAPVMVQSASNPEGTPIGAFDEIRADVLADRSQFYQELSVPFYGANRAGAAVSQGQRDQFWRLGMQVGLKAAYDCVKAFSETDFTDDLRALQVPILIAHGDDDQIVPIARLGPQGDRAGQAGHPQGVPRRPARHPGRLPARFRRGPVGLHRRVNQP